MNCQNPLHNHLFPTKFFNWATLKYEATENHEIVKCEYSNARRICHNDNCEHCYNKSLMTHLKAKYWVYNDKQNPKFECPRWIMVGSGEHIRMYCTECPHEFSSELKHMTGRKSTNCPHCCSNGRLCENKVSCDFCFNRSFASHEKAQFWHPTKNGTVTPRDIMRCVNTPFTFICINCPHEFDLEPHYIVSHGRWCPYHSITNMQLCPKKGCWFCEPKSFASSPMVEFYSKKNIDEDGKFIEPWTLTIWSDKPYWFECEDGHEFQLSLHRISAGGFCPHCHNKTEAKVFGELNKRYKVVRQATFDWCRNPVTNRCYPFDFHIICTLNMPEILLNLIGEVDGPHHQIQISNWRTPEENQRIDLYKMNKANENGLTIIRISQEDILLDKIDWVEELNKHIHPYKNPCRVYIATQNIFAIYRTNDIKNYQILLTNISIQETILFNSCEELAKLVFSAFIFKNVCEGYIPEKYIEYIEHMINNEIIYVVDEEHKYKIDRIDRN